MNKLYKYKIFNLEIAIKLLPIFFFTLIAGCAPRAVGFISSDYNPSRIQRVALVYFEDYPGAVGSGEIAASTFEKYLLQAGYKLVERRQVARILKEQSLDLSGFIDKTTIHTLGKILGVNALAFGSLTDFTNIREQTVMVNIPQQQSDPIFGQVITEQKNKDTKVTTVQNVITGYNYTLIPNVVPQTETLPAHVGMSVRLVDVETGEVLWSASASSDGEDMTVATQEASSKLIQSVIKELKQTSH